METLRKKFSCAIIFLLVSKILLAQDTRVNYLPQPLPVEPLLKDGLVGWWYFNEGSGERINDYSGNNLTGTLQNVNFNASSGWVPTEKGLTLRLDGSNDYVLIADDPAFDFNQEVTMIIYFKSISTPSSGDIVVFEKYHDIGMISLDISSTNSYKINFALYGIRWTWTAGAGATYNSGVWHFVACVYDGSSAKVYVDGELDWSESASGTLTNTTDPLTIGARVSSGTPAYWSNIDVKFAAVYSRALSQSEIKFLYDNVDKVLQTDLFTTAANIRKKPTAVTQPPSSKSPKKVRPRWWGMLFDIPWLRGIN